MTANTPISSQQLQALETAAHRLEEEKEAKKQARLDKKKRQEQVKKHSFWEKLVAPMLLIATVIVSALVMLL